MLYIVHVQSQGFLNKFDEETGEPICSESSARIYHRIEVVDLVCSNLRARTKKIISYLPIKEDHQECQT